MSVTTAHLADGSATERTDRFAVARRVADTVLYEGYVLYPYRASAQKNQLRWQFGVLAPAAYAQSSGCERWSMRSEVIVDPGDKPVLSVRIRCLQVQHRDVESTTDGGATFAPVEALDAGDRTVVPWDEALEREIDVDPLQVSATVPPTLCRFVLPPDDVVEDLHDRLGNVIGRTVRHSEEVHGAIRISTEPAPGEGGLLKVTIDVENTTDWDGAGADRDTAMRRSLVAVHTLLAIDHGSFVSLLEPAEFAAAAVQHCISDGTFPVLIGDTMTNDVMLSSPIILYDFPSVAPESAGDFCDATEIDEILALRVMTLTDGEKAEARGTDARAAAIVDRCDDMPPELWKRLHGAIRSLQPLDEVVPHVPWWDPGQDASFDPYNDTMRIGTVDVGNGTRVRLRPSHRADAHDLFYAGRLATVKGVFNDVDGERHLAVALDDDPAADMLEWQGRFLYFHPDEVEVLQETATRRVLVAGIGNIFLGDDGFGVEVVNHIDTSDLPAGVTVADYGIRGVHLSYELLDGYDALVLIDAMPLGEPPGTVVIFEPDVDSVDPTSVDAHSMSPAVVLGLLAGLGGRVPRVVVVGCQPLTVDEGLGLSEPVASAVVPAAEIVRHVLDDILLNAPKELYQ